MNSRIVRALFVFLVIAIGINAGYFLIKIDKVLAAERSAADALRLTSAGALATLADLRAAQMGYVARGQGEAFWMTRVSSLLPGLDEQLATLKTALTAPGAQSDLEGAAAAVDNFHKLDARAQDFVKSGDGLLASDLIFSDGLEAVSTASTQIQAAVGDELQARQTGVTALRIRQLQILGGASGGVLLIVLLLGFTAVGQPKVIAAAVPAGNPAQPIEESRPKRTLLPLQPAAEPQAQDKALAKAARICTEMARAQEVRQLPGLLERAAGVLDASGMIVWVADPARKELRSVMACGYSDQALTRMGSIPVDAANAVAHAYRSAHLRAVTGHHSTTGALVTPLFVADHCIGVLAAEMKGGSETDERSQALASIFAAQLATLVSPPPDAALTHAANG